MTRAWVSLTVLLATAGLLCWAAEKGTEEKDAVESAGLTIGEPIREGNLTIFPVISKSPKQDDRFITLDEGLRSGKVEILEVGAVAGAAQPNAANAPAADDPFGAAPEAENAPGAEPQEQVAEGNEPAQEEVPSRNLQQAIQYAGNDVNRLMVVNRSEKPLYLMPGEVIVGGDQDRTIGRELVIAPDGKPTSISVFCVEHGRWGSRDTQQYAGYLSADLALTVAQEESLASANDLSDTSAEAQASSRPLQAERALASVSVERITEQANSGKFIGSIGSLNKGARLAVQKGEGQGEVWNQVSMQNAAAGVKPQSGAFTANYASEDVTKRLDGYQSKLQKPVAETSNVVGVIVAVNGKVESMDVFESTPLFTKLWPKLLKSYALDALNKVEEKVEDEKKLSIADATRFMNDVASASTKSADRGEGLATVQAENDRVLLFSAREQSGELVADPVSEASIPITDAAPAAYGGFGGGVHTSAFSK